MPPRVSLLPVVVLATVSLLLGALAAWTEADGKTPAPRPAVAPPTLPAPAARPVPVCDATRDTPAAEPVPQALLDAFGVLRRERAERDALPQEALTALRARGLEPFDPTAARELRTTAEGGRAWVVPVRDAGAGLRPVPCVPKGARRVPRAAVATPAPGLAVVATGGAPAGGGGALGDLVRGRGALATDPCSGPGRDMLTVSGIVPDGVIAAFLTAQDGTAVRADVQDNAYAFVVPRPTRREQRYVVWTGGDGTPHVQPVTAVALPARLKCAPAPSTLVRVTPEPGCSFFFTPLLPARAVPTPVPRPGRTVRVRPPRRPATPVAVPVPVAAATCVLDAPLALPVPARP